MPIERNVKRRRALLPSTTGTANQQDDRVTHPVVTPNSERKPSGQNDDAPLSNLKQLNDFVIVKVYSLDNKCKNFVAQIISGPDEDGDFGASFLKRSTKLKNGFFYPEIEDLASIEFLDVIKVLPQPLPIATIKRLAGIIKLDANICTFGV